MKNALFLLIINIVMNCYAQDNTPYFKKNNDGMFALLDKNGEVLTKYKYSYISDFENGIAHVAEIRIEKDDYSYLLNQGFINRKGMEIIKPIYDEVSVWDKQKLIKLEKDKRIGFCDYNGNIIAPIMYSYMFRLDADNGLVKVQKEKNGDNYFGYINRKGATIIPCEYINLSDFSKGLAYGYKRPSPSNSATNEIGMYSTYGVLDSLGNTVIPMIYDEVLSYSNGLFRVKQNKKYGYVDYNGKVVIPIEYGYAQHTASENGLFLVKKSWNEDEYFINLNNKKVFTPVGYDDVHSFLENRAIVKKNKKYGFIDENGELIVPLIYDDATGFKNQLARVELNNKIGFINLEGKAIIPIRYDEAYTYYFSEKYVKLRRLNNFYYFDINGNEVTEKEYNSIQN